METVDLIDFDGMYTGCDYDAETGLTYHWNRWRSEDGSSFVSEDPIRDGMNWYGYAGQNTMVYVDRIWLFYNGESLLRNGENFKSDLNKALELTKIGDVIGLSKDENGKDIHHVGIITKIENGRLYYDAHTTDRNMAEVNFAGDKSIVIIHIKEEAE